jgi:hypothetical protein
MKVKLNFQEEKFFLGGISPNSLRPGRAKKGEFQPGTYERSM